MSPEVIKEMTSLAAVAVEPGEAIDVAIEAVAQLLLHKLRDETTNRQLHEGTRDLKNCKILWIMAWFAYFDRVFAAITFHKSQNLVNNPETLFSLGTTTLFFFSKIIDDLQKGNV